MVIAMSKFVVDRIYGVNHQGINYTVLAIQMMEKKLCRRDARRVPFLQPSWKKVLNCRATEYMLNAILSFCVITKPTCV